MILTFTSLVAFGASMSMRSGSNATFQPEGGVAESSISEAGALPLLTSVNGKVASLPASAWPESLSCGPAKATSGWPVTSMLSSVLALAPPPETSITTG